MGDANAQCAWGTIVASGKHGVRKNFDEGVNWIRKAAEQGNPEAIEFFRLLRRESVGFHLERRVYRCRYCGKRVSAVITPPVDYEGGCLGGSLERIFIDGGGHSWVLE